MLNKSQSISLFDEYIEHEHIKKAKGYDVCWRDASGIQMIRKFEGGEAGYNAAHRFSHSVHGVVYER